MPLCPFRQAALILLILKSQPSCLSLSETRMSYIPSGPLPLGTFLYILYAGLAKLDLTQSRDPALMGFAFRLQQGRLLEGVCLTDDMFILMCTKWLTNTFIFLW